LTPACAGLLELRGSSRLKMLKSMKISYADGLALSLAISVQFTLKMCVAVRNHEKFTKPVILIVHCRSRSSMLIKLNNPQAVLVMICHMSLLICNHFYTRRANNGKIPYLYLTLSFEGNPLTQGHEILSQKLYLGAAHSKDFVTLACIVLIGLKSVTAGRADTQTDS